MLVHYAAHPTVLNQYNLYYSRDFPGVAVDYLESKLGSSVMAILLMERLVISALVTQEELDFF